MRYQDLRPMATPRQEGMKPRAEGERAEEGEFVLYEDLDAQFGPQGGVYGGVVMELSAEDDDTPMIKVWDYDRNVQGTRWQPLWDVPGEEEPLRRTKKAAPLSVPVDAVDAMVSIPVDASSTLCTYAGISPP